MKRILKQYLIIYCLIKKDLIVLESSTQWPTDQSSKQTNVYFPLWMKKIQQTKQQQDTTFICNSLLDIKWQKLGLVQVRSQWHCNNANKAQIDCWHRYDMHHCCLLHLLCFFLPVSIISFSSNFFFFNF